MDYNSIMEEWYSYLGKLPDLLLALIVLFVGWLVAKGVASVVRKALHKTSLDDKLFGGSQNKYSSEKIVSKIVYYLILVFVFIMFFNILSLSFIATPLVSMLSAITATVPNVLKAALILLLGWAVASLLSWTVRKFSKGTKIGSLLKKWKITSTDEEATKAVHNASKIVFYLVLLIFLPGVLSALDITGTSEPFANMIGSLLGFIPKLFAAVLIVFIGWLVAKIVRDILSNFLKSIGTERFAERLGLTKFFEGTSLSSVIGTIVFILIMIPTIISALEQLDIKGISEPAIAMLNDVLTMLPNIAVSIILILAGLFVGKWVKSMVSSLLERLGFNSILNNMGIGKWNPSESKLKLSEIAGYIAQIFVVLLFVVEALELINLDFLVTLATGVIAYLPSLFAAIVILAVGLYVGNLVKKLLLNVLEGPSYRILASIAKYSIVVISFFMALDQLGVADSIVNSAFILILGGLALAFGLAFGLGGKEFANKHLQTLDSKLEQMSVNKTNRNENDDFNNL
ncbi:mechanosensitive ion channel [Pseudalkalibacillus berkeleyi]|uniref:Mechanosensitive ion channel n=1 Tax=Pseudalkalibacillus berkeleyi TaxID=1069813 RepID=A0ABS9GW56_9BACL|nr:mechanosensitive ion channel [Pseudalkalibacillus berkeleyi]MCF6136929.1 mechanosensitive ion channel [Pseudalkalibacillus berkeleyi]